MRNARERQGNAGSRCYFRPDRVKIPKTHLTRLSRVFPRPLQLHLRKSLIKYWRRNGKQHVGRRETKRKKHKQGRKSRRRRRIEARINALSLRNSVDLCTRRDRVHGWLLCTRIAVNSNLVLPERKNVTPTLLVSRDKYQLISGLHTVLATFLTTLSTRELCIRQVENIVVTVEKKYLQQVAFSFLVFTTDD